MRNRLAILMYHRVLNAPDVLRPWDVTADMFDWQVRCLSRWFNVFSLGEGVRRLREGTLPSRAVSITFDDGYADNYELALPVLQRYGVSATVFVAPGYINGGRMWNDTVIESFNSATTDFLALDSIGLGRVDLSNSKSRFEALMKVITSLKYLPPDERARKADSLAASIGTKLPNNLMMTNEQVIELHRSGVEIGAHTVNHPILAKVDDASARKEIIDSKLYLENLLAAPVTTFAFPNGRPHKDYGATHVKIVRDAGFKLAVSTAWGSASRTMDIHQLPRIAPWDQTPLRFTYRVMRSFFESDPALVS